MTREEEREILRLAAKVVGQELCRWWNPLIHTDDATRLAYLLNLDVQHGKNFVRVSGVVPWAPLNNVTVTATMDNPEKHRMKAEREAIVRVAAEIGRKMGDAE